MLKHHTHRPLINETMSIDAGIIINNNDNDSDDSDP